MSEELGLFSTISPLGPHPPPTPGTGTRLCQRTCWHEYELKGSEKQSCLAFLLPWDSLGYQKATLNKSTQKPTEVCSMGLNPWKIFLGLHCKSVAKQMAPKYPVSIKYKAQSGHLSVEGMWLYLCGLIGETLVMGNLEKGTLTQKSELSLFMGQPFNCPQESLQYNKIH